jgi:hypothetical protein
VQEASFLAAGAPATDAILRSPFALSQTA